MELSREQCHAIALALTEGQGGFTEEELAQACNEIAIALVAGEMAALALEGQLLLKLKDGELSYEASARGRADFQNHLAERGISLEQFKEELRRER